jgi:hypothetical protein
VTNQVTAAWSHDVFVLQAGAQKAHVDCQVEQYEQDIARLKLKYQLQMKVVLSDTFIVNIIG